MVICMAIVPFTHTHTSLQLYLVKVIHKMCAVSSYSSIDRSVSEDCTIYIFMVVDAVLFIYFWIQPPHGYASIRLPM